MLLQFVVENVLSFRDKAVLSMLAADGVPHSEAQCVRFPGLLPVLKCAAIYGANGSGKSNLVKAFKAARRIVVDGTKAGEQIPLRRFKLEAASLAAPSRFEIDLHAAGRRYSYGFVVTPEEVESEWLFVSDGGEEQPLFERERPSGGGDRPTITLGPALTEDEARRRFIAFVAEGTRPNQLFLTECAERNVGELGVVTKWFRSGVAIDRSSIIDFVSEFRILESEAFRDYLGKLLKDAGTGVSQITVEPRRESEIPSDDLIEETQRVMEAMRQTTEATLRGMPLDSRVKLHHPSRNGTLVPFVPDEESDGTRRLMALAPFLFDLLQPQNGTPAVHLIDELDKSLHPLLTRFFLETFFRSSSAEHPGQILFTTHDTNLLDLSLLSRDSIWFTEKDASGASSLYSLSEFKGEQLDRIGEHLEEGYLQGRFGAIPFLGDPRRLGWSMGGKE
jgi:uncharacterized protein